VDRWLVSRSHAIAPPSDGDFDAAYLVLLSRGSTLREVVVEFVAPSAVTSVGYAEEVARPFQRDDEPPQHLIVERDGRVRVLIGARKQDAGNAAPPISGDTPSHDPQRARLTDGDEPPVVLTAERRKGPASRTLFASVPHLARFVAR
jgi:hypothetical protein